MDMNSLLPPHGALDGFRGPATSVPSFQNTSLPGLRKHLPSLPIRLAALSAPSQTAAPNDHAHPRRPDLAPLNAAHAPSHQSLAPLRFIIPSTHCSGSVSSFPSANTTSDSNVNIRPAVAPSLPSAAVFKAASQQVRDVFASHESAQRAAGSMDINPQDPVTQEGGDQLMPDSATSFDGQAKTKKSPGRRSRAVKNPNRSTKSKARPGLRKGKWTEEEERYAAQLTMYFKEGLLPIARGTMLRLYLSQKLNCEPMRITKKFTGGECIGKQVFRPCSPTPEAKVRRMQAQLELVALEAAFIKKLQENKEEVPGLTDGENGAIPPGGMLPVKSKKRRPRHDGETHGDEDRDDGGFTSDSSSDGASSTSADGKRNVDGMDDASAVGLLLDFFYKASRNGDDARPALDRTTPPAVASVLPASSSTTIEPEPESDSDDRVSSTLRSSEELASSPTKRMRTLSISNSVADVTTPKRSRVGSFSVMSMSNN
ncbi:hypothetical protein ATCC90586_005121 [Pythium insidiosum]|nr:hypothetical protein ATCC90586_005121 [Pythium insidiosum]